MEVIPIYSSICLSLMYKWRKEIKTRQGNHHVNHSNKKCVQRVVFVALFTCDSNISTT